MRISLRFLISLTLLRLINVGAILHNLCISDPVPEGWIDVLIYQDDEEEGEVNQSCKRKAGPIRKQKA